MMGHSVRLRASDVLGIYRLVNECRELWADAEAWRQHLVTGASKLTGMAVVHYAEYSPRGPNGKSVSHCNADCGWRDASTRAVYLAAVEAHPDAFHLFPGSERYLPRLKAGRDVIALRSDMCDDRRWYQSPVYNEFRRAAFNDDFAVSIIPHRNGVHTLVDLNQDSADPRPTQRTKGQLKLLHRLIDPFIGTELASDSQLGVAGLSPKLRETLELLLDGATEKAIAAKLGVRPTTVHENVGKIYRHFRVRSRAELMAYFIRRQPKSRQSI